MNYPFESDTYLFPNLNNDPWIVKYNNLVLNIKSGTYNVTGQKLSKHHIIPKSIAPELKDNKNNFVFLPIPERMMLHYYLWKSNPIYGRQLWFGCVWCRKNKIWDLPGGYEEFEELKKSLKRTIL